VIRVTFANAGTLGAFPGKRDELVAHPTQRSDRLKAIGCLSYEVGVNDDEPTGPLSAWFSTISRSRVAAGFW
jgi:hypothetical protein